MILILLGLSNLKINGKYINMETIILGLILFKILSIEKKLILFL